jgi:hypothetical protein
MEQLHCRADEAVFLFFCIPLLELPHRRLVCSLWPCLRREELGLSYLSCGPNGLMPSTSSIYIASTLIFYRRKLFSTVSQPSTNETIVLARNYEQKNSHKKNL